MYGIHMAAVIQILGPHAHYLRRYGVNPEEDASTAIDKLNAKAPHLAALLREIAQIASLQ
ncbi:MAG: hypothetical protein GU356_02195 [Pyrobaculum sp.]|jgi:hypothetical protein|nr:hypothetical protein [Pyrobaculum sp.]